MARPRKYDWDKWLYQPCTVLIRGIHYHCSQSTMASVIRNSASQRRIAVKVVDTGIGITIEINGVKNAVQHTT